MHKKNFSICTQHFWDGSPNSLTSTTPPTFCSQCPTCLLLECHPQDTPRNKESTASSNTCKPSPSPPPKSTLSQTTPSYPSSHRPPSNQLHCICTHPQHAPLSEKSTGSSPIYTCLIPATKRDAKSAHTSTTDPSP